MTRVIVHPGFHKTGTTSLQTYMVENQAALADYAHFYTKEHFLRAGNLARRYGMKPTYWYRWRFGRALRRFLTTIPDAPVVILSWECFSGVMPGHRRLTGTITGFASTARPMSRTINAELRHRFGADTEVVWFYTTRELESWLRSIYGHILRSIRIQDDYPTFRARLAKVPAPVVEAELMRDYLAPMPVRIAPLEDFADNRLGQASALLELAGVPAEVMAGLPDALHSNRGNPPELLEKFLELNRKLSDKKLLHERKHKLIRQYHRRQK